MASGGIAVTPSKQPASQRQADRALCSIRVAETLGLQVRVVASAMRTAGVSEPLTLAQAKSWQAMTVEPPAWMIALLVDAATRRSRREHHAQQRAVEEEHRMLLVADKVQRRLLAGQHIRGADAMHIATDLAFRAQKELCRGARPEDLFALDLAALRWAGVDPHDRNTWFLIG